MDLVTVHVVEPNGTFPYSVIDNETFVKGETLSPIWSLEYFILSVMIASASIVGTIGNIPVLIVYFRRKENMASNTFIKVLAFLDLLVCAFVMPYTIVYELHLVTSDPACRTFEFLRHFAISASNVTLVAIAVERYIAVCQISRKLSVRSINCGMWIIIVASGIIASPAVGTFAVVDQSEVEDIKCLYPHQATSGRFCHFTFSIMGEMLVTMYQGVLILIFFVSLFLIVVMYVLIYLVLWKKTKIKRNMVSKDSASGMEIRLSIANTGYTEVFSKQNECTQELNGNSPKRKCSTVDETSAVQEDISTSSGKIPVVKPQVTFGRNNEAGRQSVDSQNKTKPNGTTRSHRPHRKSKFSSLSVKSEKERRRRHYHRRTAKMLFLCTFIYFTTWMPFWLDIFGLTNSLILRYFFFFGNASNPIVYGIVNEQVRRSFKKLFFECIHKWCGFMSSDDDRDETLNTSDIRSR